MLLHHILTIHRVWRDCKAATAIEYGLIAALIAVAAVGVMGSVGSKLRNTFSNVSNNLKVG